MKCQYAGCKNKAVYQTTQTVGKCQTLLICEDCAPEWVKKLKPITKFYTVEMIEMTNQQISKTWEVNLLPYVKIMENGNVDKEKRAESFNNWVDILIERGNINSVDGVEYIGNEI